MRLDALSSPISSHGRRVRVGQGRFAWWVGVLRRTESPKWDVWHCGHQHRSAEDARSCVDELLYALNGSAEPLRLRND